jgi:hypothetical protein
MIQVIGCNQAIMILIMNQVTGCNQTIMVSIINWATGCNQDSAQQLPSFLADGEGGGLGTYYQASDACCRHGFFSTFAARLPIGPHMPHGLPLVLTHMSHSFSLSPPEFLLRTRLVDPVYEH